MLSALLAEREKDGKPIRVGIIGTGKFGGGLVTQISRMKGMVVSAIADTKPEHARYAYNTAYGDVEVGTVDSPQALEEAIHAGRFTVVEDGLQVAQADGLDVVVEAAPLVRLEGVARLGVGLLEGGQAEPLSALRPRYLRSPGITRPKAPMVVKRGR